MSFTVSYIVGSFSGLIANATYKTGLLPSTLLVLLLDFSKNANSEASKLCNNFFAIEACANWQGISLSINGYEAPIRMYNDRAGSIKDFVGILKEEDRRQDLGVFRAKKTNTQLERIEALLGKSSGWSESLMKKYEDVDFESFDEQLKSIHDSWR